MWLTNIQEENIMVFFGATSDSETIRELGKYCGLRESSDLQVTLCHHRKNGFAAGNYVVVGCGPGVTSSSHDGSACQQP